MSADVKVFISQPMDGLKEDEIKAKRAEAINTVRSYYGKKKVEILDSYFEDAPKSTNPPLWWLSQSLEVMSHADVAFFIGGWDKARGCMIENTCAHAYGLTTIEENNIGDLIVSDNK